MIAAQTAISLAFETHFSNHAACPQQKFARSKQRVWFETDIALVFFDGYPISEGHALVIPKTHVASIFDLPAKDLAEVWELVGKIRAELQKKYSPDAFNIGINDGFAAGQTVPHAHIHVIPRRKGDVADPRGGVRWVISDKAKYW